MNADLEKMKKLETMTMKEFMAWLDGYWENFSDIEPGFTINISGAEDIVYTILSTSTNSLLLNKSLTFNE